MKNTNRFVFVKLMLVSIALFGSLYIQAQLPKGVTLDGSLNLLEMNDTAYFKTVKTTTHDIFIKENLQYYYFSVHSTGIVNILISKNDTLWVLHTSGCTTRGIYTIDKNDSVQIVKPILPVNKYPEAWDFIGAVVSKNLFKKEKSSAEVNEELAACLKKNDYAATTFDMGSRYDFEFVFAKSLLQNSKIMIAYSNWNGKAAQYPANVVLTGDKKRDEMIYNGTLEGAGRFKFSDAEWLLLR